MRYKKTEKLYMVRIDRGEEIIERLRVFAEKEKIDFASVQGLGAVSEFTVGVYDAKKRNMLQITFWVRMKSFL